MVSPIRGVTLVESVVVIVVLAIALTTVTQPFEPQLAVLTRTMKPKLSSSLNLWPARFAVSVLMKIPQLWRTTLRWCERGPPVPRALAWASRQANQHHPTPALISMMLTITMASMRGVAVRRGTVFWMWLAISGRAIRTFACRLQWLIPVTSLRGLAS